MKTVASTWQKPFVPPERVPDSADVVIVGGGIVGTSAAWFLARQGVRVVLCEKGHIGGEQSGRNWGWVRVQGRDVREIPMMLDAFRTWESFADETGEDLGFTRRGCLFAARDEKELHGFEGWLEDADDHGIESRLLTAAEVAEFAPGAQTKWVGGVITESDGRAEPQKAAPAFARAAVKAGASVLTACAVRGVETEAGCLSAVVTEHGTIRTNAVLLAAGAWSSLFCRSLGIALPQLKVRGTVTRTAPKDGMLEGNLFDSKLGIRRRDDGGYTVAHGTILHHSITPSTFRWTFKFLPSLMKEIKVLRLSFGKEFFDEWRQPKQWALDSVSPFEMTRVLDPEPSDNVVRGIRRHLDTMFPQLADTPIVESWGGMVETTPDVVPVIDSVATLPGFHIATGFSGHGFGLGPGAGKAAAALVTGDTPPVNIVPLRLNRFFDGSPIELLSSI
jgi:glycine/D-amino acid oxidase-like deaminating enzyme